MFPAVMSCWTSVRTSRRSSPKSSTLCRLMMIAITWNQLIKTWPTQQETIIWLVSIFKRPCCFLLFTIFSYFCLPELFFLWRSSIGSDGWRRTGAGRTWDISFLLWKSDSIREWDPLSASPQIQTTRTQRSWSLLRSKKKNDNDRVWFLRCNLFKTAFDNQNGKTYKIHFS